MKHLRKFDSVSDMETTLANSTIGILGVAYEGGNAVMENKPTPPAPVIEYTVTIMTVPEEGGTFTGDGNYATAQSVTLSATPNSGFRFAQWNINGVDVFENPYTFNITEDCFVILLFEEEIVTYSLNATILPLGADTVCSVTGTGMKTAGTNPRLTAVASDPYTFEQWELDGVVQGTTPQLNIYNIQSDLTYTAVFRYIPQVRTITVTSDNPSYGTVQIEDYQHQTSNTSLVIRETTNATLTATPNAGYQFEGWYYNNEKVSSDAVYTFTLPDHSTDRTYTANFSVTQA
jgi:uncharacterized repeat protein (TIGR02543 family)